MKLDSKVNHSSDSRRKQHFNGFDMGLQWKGFYSLRPLRTLIFVRLFRKGNYSKMGKIVSKINGGNLLLTKRIWSGIKTHFFSCLAILNDNKLPPHVFHRNVKTYGSTARKDTTQSHPRVSVTRPLLGRRRQEDSSEQAENILCTIQSVCVIKMRGSRPGSHFLF